MDPAQIYRQHPLRNPPPPTAPPEMPPFLERPQQGRSDGRSPPHVDSWRPPQHDFTFRNNPSAPQFPRETDRYGPASDPRRRNNNRRGYAQNNRGRAFRRPTAERPLLSSKRGLSPEDVLGQTDAQNAAHRFLPADDVSDSEEEEMEESDDEQQPTTYGHQGVAPSASTDGVVKTSDLHGASEASGPPTKRRATAVKDTEEAASVPKWSNPDPYTVLPPVDETQRKRKDVVKIIRKARITAEKELASENQVAANDDFISFGLEVENDSDEESPPTTPEPGIPGAPTGPRAFSHLDNLRGAAPDRAPGASTQRPSANELGPPPDLRDTYPMRSGRQVSRVDLYPEQAEALGNRKRTFEDDIKGDVVPGAKKRKKIPASTGSVLPQWMTREDTDSTPWLAGDHRSTESLGFRLHKEICDFYEFVRPQRYEQIVREDLLQRLQTAIKKQLPGCDLYCFGSFAAEMYLPNADMDLVIISSTFRRSGNRVACQNQSQMYKFAHHLEQIGLATRGSTEVIHSAKVPLVKFIDQMTGIQVDVSFENETGLVANETFTAWKQQFPAMPILTTVIKQFLKMRGLSEVVNGGLGGFSVTCLVTSLLQNLPRVQSGEIIPEQHLGEMLLEFLDLYGNQFDLARTGVSMRPPGYYDKQAAERYDYRREVYRGNRASRLAIMDPNNRQNDISGGSKNVSLIFDLFSEAHEEIMEAMKSSNSFSLLGWTLGGDYRSFTIQRRRLRELYRLRWGDLEPSQTLKESHESDPSLPISNEEIHAGRAPSLSGLPVSIFSNPLEPNVVVQPKKNRPKKKEKNNANQKIVNADTSNAQASDPPKQVNLYKLRNRARKLKARFPSMVADIPDEVNKQMRRTILEKAKAAKIIPIETNPGNILARQRRALREANGEPRKPCTKPKKAKNVKPKSQSKRKPKPGPHEVSKARLAETARNIGNAHSFPIIID